MGRKRKKADISKRKRRRRRIWLIVLIIFLVLVVSLGAAGAFAYYYAKNVIEEKAVKDINPDDIYSLIYEKTTIYDKEGKEIDALYLTGGNRTIIQYDEIPDNLINAVVDTEDKTFWEHEGFNYVRMLGAIKERIFGGGQISGTSTITQQLARNIYLSETMTERTLERKILEAYYTTIIEQELSKEQILETYLNAVYFGFNAYGIDAAAETYFGKEPSELDLAECAALAALPQSPDTYALVKADYTASSGDLPVIAKGDGVVYLYNGAASEKRRKLILSNMEEAGDITAAEKKAALAESIEDHLKLDTEEQPAGYTYYIDCAIDEAVSDVAAQYGITEEEARTMIYTKGYDIYTCLDRKVQDTLDKEINTDSNYAAISYINKDGNGNIISSSGDVLMRPYDRFFDDEDRFKLSEDDFSKEDNGEIKLYKGRKLDFYAAESGGSEYVTVDFKGVYVQKEGALYFLEGGGLLIPAGYTSLDSDGNCIVSAQFSKDFPDFFIKDGDSLKVAPDNYKAGQKMRQPQAAAVIIDNESGCVVAMTGGRGAKGKRLYNRAISPRQPGSSIKPIGVYGPALQKSVEAAKEGKKMELSTKDGDKWGDYITAGSVINDAAIYLNGKAWPRNDYGGYQGPMTLRHAVQQSVNVVAVKIFRQIGSEYSIEMLKKNGITSIVEEGSTADTNDALALGGMTKGISPLELTAAFETFANGGTYTKPRFYTSITDGSGELLLENEIEEERIYDNSVAWIMTDILKSAVEKGTGKNAKVEGQDVAGKTGTTSSQFDVWFSGFTPHYSMALWMGSDVNIPLANYSSAAAAFWSEIMTNVSSGLPSEKFPEMPYSVVKVNGEYYAEGTQPKQVEGTDTGTGTLPGQDATSVSGESTTTSPTDGAVNNYYDTPVDPGDF